MISHSILFTSGTDRRRIPTQHISPNDPDYKQHTFNRVFGNCVLFKGDRVKLKGSNKEGTVIDVLTSLELDQVKWDKNRPHFIVVKFDGTDKEYLAHPSQLRKRRV